MPVRLAAVCGLVAPLTYVAGLVVGGLAQPDEFSSADDAISDLGAKTASSAWLYNQVGLNITDAVFAVGRGSRSRRVSSAAWARRLWR